MLEDERHMQTNKNSKFVEILLSIIKFFPNFTIDIWEKIKKLLGIKITEKNEENSNNIKLVKEDKGYENDYSKFNEDINYNNNSNIYIEVKYQSQMQANKQKLKQLESQTYSNRTMARLVSTAE